MAPTIAPKRSAAPPSRVHQGVTTGPGETVFTRTPCGANSSDSAWPRFVSAAFAAEYSPLNGDGWRALAEETLTITPPPASTSTGSAARQTRTVACRLSSKMPCQSASSRVRKPAWGSGLPGTGPPALLTTTSRRP